jgi:hypothetical protein
MKRLFFLALLLVFNYSSFSQTHLYENPNFDELVKDHKIIGIIPFKASITLRPKQMKEITQEQLEKMEIDEGQSVQSAFYSWFMKREKQGKLLIKVQSPAVSNAALQKAGVNRENYERFTPGELAKIMGVDAIILGTFETNKPMSEGASAALGLLGGFYGSTNKAVINIFIHNAVDNEMLVNYHKGVSGSLGSSTEDLINTVLRKASRRISYSKGNE